MQAGAADKIAKGKLPAEAQERLDESVDDARKTLAKLLDDGWLPDAEGRSAKLNDVVDACAKIDFGTVREDKKFVRSRLADIAGDVQKHKLDMHDLEGGVHELRRKLRWIPITLIALDGLVSLDDKAGGPFAELKNAPVAQTPFAKLPAPAGVDKERIQFAWPLFLALSQAIGDLGKIKDRGQLVEGIAESLDPKHPEKAHAQAEKLLGDTGALHHVEGAAAALLSGLEDGGLLKLLSQAFRD